MSKARQKWDAKDTLVILTTFADRDLFSANPNLRNIMTGVNADNAVNVDRARAIGEKILSSMTEKSVTHYTFKHSFHAVVLAAKSSVRTQLLFQQLIIACNRSDYLQGLLNCAVILWLCSVLQSQKPVLADAIWAKLTSNATSGPEGDVRHVLDG